MVKTSTFHDDVTLQATCFLGLPRPRRSILQQLLKRLRNFTNSLLQIENHVSPFPAMRASRKQDFRTQPSYYFNGSLGLHTSYSLTGSLVSNNSRPSLRTYHGQYSYNPCFIICTWSSNCIKSNTTSRSKSHMNSTFFESPRHEQEYFASQTAYPISIPPSPTKA